MKPEDEYREIDLASPEADVKQVMVVRRDLKMRKGKIGSQTGHAAQRSLSHRPGAYVRDGASGPELVVPLTAEDVVWLQGEYKKIVLGVDSEAQLLELHAKAEAAGLRCDLVADNGHTEFHGVKTTTALVIGPHIGFAINRITGHLDPL